MVSDSGNGGDGMNERRYLSVELNPGQEEMAFKAFLRDHKIKAESSGCFNLVHFEVLVDETERELCDEFLARL